MKNTIVFEDFEQFLDACYILSTKGAVFEASAATVLTVAGCADCLTITITGY